MLPGPVTKGPGGALRKETHLPSENETSRLLAEAEKEEGRLGSERSLLTTKGVWAVWREWGTR